MAPRALRALFAPLSLLLLLLLLLLFAFLFVVLHDPAQRRPAPVPPWTPADQAVLDAWAAGGAGTEPPVVLVSWTGFFGRAGFAGRYGPLEASACPARCLLVNQRQFLPVASGVLVHAADLAWTDLPPRDVGGRRQTWTVVSQESPATDRWPLAHPEWLRLFDYAMTYRRDSDFPIVYVPQRIGENVRRPLRVAPDRRNPDVPVVWVASNCHANNGREAYIRELMRHIPVHSYGACLHNAEWPTRAALGLGARGDASAAGAAPADAPASVQEVIRQYHFYLAIENSDCADYITEKFFNALEAGVVPVVNGPRARYEAFLPVPDAAVFLDEFASPAALAAHLSALSRDRAAYAALLRFHADDGLAGDGADRPANASEAAVPLAPAFQAMAAAAATRLDPFCAYCVRTHADLRAAGGELAVADDVRYDRDGAPLRRTAAAVRPDTSCIPVRFAAYQTPWDRMMYWFAVWNVGAWIGPRVVAPLAVLVALGAFLRYRRRPTPSSWLDWLRGPGPT